MMDAGDDGQQMGAPVGVRDWPGESRTPSSERISRSGEQHSESAPPAGIPPDGWREDHAGRDRQASGAESASESRRYRKTRYPAGLVPQAHRSQVRRFETAPVGGTTTHPPGARESGGSLGAREFRLGIRPDCGSAGQPGASAVRSDRRQHSAPAWNSTRPQAEPDLDSRRVTIAGITAHPDQSWMQQMARNATLEHWGYLNPCRYVLHDRDKKFCASFRDTLATANVKCLALPRRSPNLNAFAERWVRSVRDECLGKLILFGESSLRRALTQFTEHYHSERNHQGKGNVLLFPGVEEFRQTSGPSI